MSIRSNVDARRLDQRVAFQRNSQTQTDTGDVPDNWRPIVACWAAVDGAKASRAEPAVDGQILSQADYTVWVRADIIERFAITVLDSVLWKGRTLNIKDIPDQQLRGRLIAVICNAGLNAG